MPYRDKNKQKEYWKKYAEKNKDRIAVRKRNWLDADPSRQARYTQAQKARYKKDPDKYRLYFRNRHVITTYGITHEQYEQMFQEQGGVCAICGCQPDIEVHGISRLAIDHCHKTKKVRGLLCNRCNAGMGIIGDTIEHLERALAYLRKQESQEE